MYGKYQWLCGRIWMEADVRWVMLAPIHQKQTALRKCWWKISTVITAQIGRVEFIFHSNSVAINSGQKIILEQFSLTRAPFGLFYHAAWFTQPHHKQGFIKFLDTINAMNDVWIVTNWQALQWVRDPTPIARINTFQPFQCNYSVSIPH